MAYRNCKFCRGRGCVACDGERERAAAKRETPVFVAAANDPRDMELLKGALGKEAIDRAFGEGGGGVQELQVNLVLASMTQLMRKEEAAGDDGTAVSEVNEDER